MFEIARTLASDDVKLLKRRGRDFEKRYIVTVLSFALRFVWFMRMGTLDQKSPCCPWTGNTTAAAQAQPVAHRTGCVRLRRRVLSYSSSNNSLDALSTAPSRHKERLTSAAAHAHEHRRQAYDCPQPTTSLYAGPVHTQHTHFTQKWRHTANACTPRDLRCTSILVSNVVNR